MMATMGLGGVAALAMKALGVSMMALMLAGIAGLKKLTEGGGDGGHSVHYVRKLCAFNVCSWPRHSTLYSINYFHFFFHHCNEIFYTGVCRWRRSSQTKTIRAASGKKPCATSIQRLPISTEDVIYYLLLRCNLLLFIDYHCWSPSVPPNL